MNPYLEEGGREGDQGEGANLRLHLWFMFALGAALCFLSCNFLLSIVSDKSEVIESIFT